MAIIILFTIIGALEVPVLDAVRPFLFTTHIGVWHSLFDYEIPKQEIINSMFILLAHIVIFFGIAVVRFNRKDILS